MAKSFFEQLEDKFLSELIPLPKAAKEEWEKGSKTLVEKLQPVKEQQRYQRQHELPKSTASSEMDLVHIPTPAVSATPQKSDSQVIEKEKKGEAIVLSKATRQQRLRTAQALREAIVISEILGPPVSLRKK
ncbi:MAG: hypothetical protein ACRCWD_02580 [Culicoidibacterales bacterium]